MTSERARHWRSAADALAAVRRVADLTRPELGHELGLNSGPTSDLVKRMCAARLIAERRASSDGPGRPTTTMHAHPDGPLAVVLDIRHGDWRLGTCAVDGTVTVTDTGHHHGSAPGRLLARLRTRVRQQVDGSDGRVVGIGVAVPGATAGSRLVHATLLGWRDIDLAPVAPSGVVTVVGNDATMAAIAENRLHSPRPHALLHLVVEVGIGGAFVVDGRPAPSAHGLHGEFGHLPFGDRDRRCPCGARGCWTVAFDIPQVARRVGRRISGDPREWLGHVFTEPDPSVRVRETRDALAGELGRGAAGLVNALDPDLVTLGGLAPALRAASRPSFERAVRAGLMAVHAERPPTIVDACASDDAAMVGAGLSVFDTVLDANRLASWAARR